TSSPGGPSRNACSATAWPACSCSVASLIPAANAAASSARIWATETIFTLRWGRNRRLWLRWRTYLWTRARPAIVGPHRIGNSAWFGAPGFFDRLDHDARRRQSARFFGQSATERLHELVVDLLATVLGQQLPHFDNVVFIAPALIGPLLEHVGPARRSTGPTNTWWTTHAHTWSAHPRTRGSWTHRSRWPRATRTQGTIAGCVYPAGWWCKLRLELARLTPTTASSTAWTTGAAARAAPRIAP